MFGCRSLVSPTALAPQSPVHYHNIVGMICTTLCRHGSSNAVISSNTTSTLGAGPVPQEAVPAGRPDSSRKRARRKPCCSDTFLGIVIGCLLVGACSASCQKDSAKCSTTGLPVAGPENQSQHQQQQLNSSSSSLSLSGNESSINSDPAVQSDSLDTTFLAEGHNRSGPVLWEVLAGGKGHGVVASTDDVVGKKMREPDDASFSAVVEGDATEQKVLADPESLSDTRPESSEPEDEEEDENIAKIVGIVIPFVCVTLFAVLVFITYKLCCKYKCCSNDKCLQKCSMFCDNCMSLPYVYQAPSGPGQEIDRTSHASNELATYLHCSRDSLPLSLHSHTRSAILRQPQGGSHKSRQALYLARQISRNPSHVSRHESGRSTRSNLLQGSRSNVSLVSQQSSSHVPRQNSSHVMRQNSSHVARQGSSRSHHDSTSSSSHRGAVSRASSQASHHSSDGAHVPMDPQQNHH